MRIAVLEEHIAAYQLETAPPKTKDKRSVFTDVRTVQAEAFAPDQLQGLVREAIRRRLDLSIYAGTLEQERAERARLKALLDTVRR